MSIGFSGTLTTFTQPKIGVLAAISSLGTILFIPDHFVNNVLMHSLQRIWCLLERNVPSGRGARGQAGV
jgi:hypothetical protein